MVGQGLAAVELLLEVLSPKDGEIPQTLSHAGFPPPVPGGVCVLCERS